MPTTYKQRLCRFRTRWLAAIKRWEAEAAPLQGRKVVVHHISWVYLWDWLGMQQIGALEPKPGVPPTSAHLASLIGTTKSGNTLAIVHAAYQDPKPSDWLTERTGVPAVTLPFTVGGDAQSKDLFGLFDSTDRQAAGSRQVTLNMEGLDISILGPACVAGLIVLSTHVPLGKQVLGRGIIFIDLAIAQIAGAWRDPGAVFRRRRTRLRRAVRRRRRGAARRRPAGLDRSPLAANTRSR